MTSPLARRSFVAMIVVTAIVCAPDLAQPPRLGPDFQVNTYTEGFQTKPDVAMNDDGDFVVVWESTATGFDEDVLGQRFNAAGVRQGTEFRVNTHTPSNQGYPAVAIQSSGAFVVTWHSDAAQDGDFFSVMAQRFNSAGGRLGKEFLVNSLTTSMQLRPAIAMDDQGGFFVVWEDNGRGGSFPAISGRFFDSTGTAVGPDFQINTYSSGQSHADIALNRDGDFLVVWSSDNQDGSGEGIFAQRFGSSGGRSGGEFQVNAYTQGRQLIASASAVGNDFVITWNSRSQDGDGYGIFARHLTDGTPSQASEFQVNSHTVGHQSLSDVAADASGDFVVTWGSVGPDDVLHQILAQRFDSDGAAEGSEFQVNTHTSLPQARSAVAVDTSGGMVVVWTSLGGYPPPSGQDGSRSGIFAQRFGNLIPFDVDRNGSFDALTDGVLFLRFAFGFRGQTLVAGAVDQQDCNRCSTEAIEAFIEDLELALDVDGDGQLAPLTDGLLAMRWAFGFRGTSLTTGAVGPGCTQCTAAEIEAYLAIWAD